MLPPQMQIDQYRKKYTEAFWQQHIGVFCKHESVPEDKDVTSACLPHKYPLMEYSEANSEQLHFS